MATHPITIDIGNNPDLIRLVEEMKHAKQPRILEENNEPVAMLMPMGHSALEVFDFQPLGVFKRWISWSGSQRHARSIVRTSAVCR